MKFPLTVCVFLLTVSRSLSVNITVRGTEGEPVSINCPYPGGYENSYKYFYKGVYRENNIILQSDGKKSSPRFSLKDDHKTRSFTVTIRNLKMEDAGLYGCIAGWGEYKQIQLNVIRAPQRPKPVQISTSTIRPHTNTSSEHASTEHASTVTHQTETETRATTGNTTDELHQPNTHLSSVAGGLGSVLLVLTLCSGTFLILKKRKRKCGTALFQQNVQHNTETDCMYEEIPNSDVAAVTSSSNQTPASHLDNHPEVSAVYTTVTNQQPDSNPGHTHSTNQVTDPDCDYYANIKSPDPTQDSGTELIYVTATHPQNISTHSQNIKTNEGPIYSVIKHE
ncbi:CMRF35-like molecule 3 isoform X3 [Ctenopharyngodon idella]|uniref:CMRF35-like molecule 3 isoform X3 n=1 Tax=Ctenopharyngodon idella TaxID=7959 RepID=UPI002231DC5D|nr:CMRF35-like molecule 3 isoform X3 [Ctenopharyngodon idella]